MGTSSRRRSEACCILRQILCLSAVSILGAPPAPASADERPAAESEAAKKEREGRLVEMREQAGEFAVVRHAGEKDERVALHGEPLMRYSDQPRGFVDATLWCWKAQGRPVALGKVEMGVNAGGVPFWMHCVASLDDVSIDIALGGVSRLRTTNAGLVLQKLPHGPVPENKSTARLRQMKELVARFAATIFANDRDKRELVPQEMRLLPSPVHRYSDEAKGIRDGIIFALTTNGTNPDVLIVIELRPEGNLPNEWTYGIVNMTSADVNLRLDDREVWVSRVSDPRETWNYFQTRRED
jgi:hypothetical protein